jgi:hypothetical protein
MRKFGWCIGFLSALLLVMARVCPAQQTGGRNKLDFLQLPTQAKSTALGTSHFTLSGYDPALFLQNPALLDSSQSGNISLNVMPYLADTRFLNLAYSNKLRKSGGSWAAGLQYLNYGTMQETDDMGNVIGEFRAADYGLSAGYAHTIGAFTLGAAAKLVSSSVASYTRYSDIRVKT